MSRRSRMIALSLAAAMGTGPIVSIVTAPPIWIAKPKRGNRRNRSRWNYRR